MSLSSTWDACLVGLDARAEGRDVDAKRTFEDLIDVAHVCGGTARRAGQGIDRSECRAVQRIRHEIVLAWKSREALGLWAAWPSPFEGIHRSVAPSRLASVQGIYKQRYSDEFADLTSVAAFRRALAASEPLDVYRRAPFQWLRKALGNAALSLVGAA